MSMAAQHLATADDRAVADALPPISVSALRKAFAQLPAVVTVVTTLGPDGPAGMTASAICSLSLDPPLLLVCAANTSRTLTRLREHGRFAVNAIPARHAAIAHAFATPEPHPGHRFSLARHHIVNAVPVLADALATFTCAVEQTQPGGDHTIVIGRILAVDTNGGQPLLWHARGYRQLTDR